MNIGYIYKITNIINDKMYIGQTTKTIEKRFKEHLRNSQREDKYQYQLYRAMRKYGTENFIVECIEKCFIEKLDEKEMFWIKYFDTFKNGYNSTLGGSGGQLLDLDEEKIINEYEKYKTIEKVAQINECSPTIIKNILEKHYIKIKSSIEHAKDKGLRIQRLSLENILLEEYECLIDAGQWLINNNLTKSKKSNYAGMSIKKAIIEEKNYYGFIWKSDFYTNEEKIRQKGRISKENKKRKRKKDTCPLCEKNQKLKSSQYCNECYNEIRKKQYDKEREEKISRKELKSLIRTTPFTKIGEQFGVSDNAIRKWCKSYGLPSKSSEIKKYTDKEWEKI